ncbi:MAG: hypothetical protein OEL79_05870 [Chromatiales bacterium]|nr:hypothetical protein [Chromatiales bacterium]
MLQRLLTLLLIVSTLLLGIAHAEVRSWGMIKPFANGTTNQNGFQGRYNPWDKGVEMDTPEPETQAPVQKRIRQRWENIYHPRSPESGEAWAESPNNEDNAAQKRVFGKTDSNEGTQEQWPERRKPRQPYRSMDRFRPPFVGGAPNMFPQFPNISYPPYGGYSPYGANGPRY